jgi:hypothetical protein
MPLSLVFVCRLSMTDVFAVAHICLIGMRPVRWERPYHIRFLFVSSTTDLVRNERSNALKRLAGSERNLKFNGFV